MRRPTDCTILMIDDEEANLELLEAALLGDGYHRLVRTTDPREAAALFEQHAPDLVLLDLHMPYRDGFSVLREIRELTPAEDYRPVLILTADVSSGAKERALAAGARDFLTKPLQIVEVLLRVHNLLETRLLHRHQQEARARAETLAAENACLFAEAQEATRARDRMLSVVAHDLRNPLALVAMNAEMMLQLFSPDADEYQRETVEIMRGATERMQRLVEDLLDVSRLEHGTFTLHLDEIELPSIFGEVGRMMRPAAQANGVALEVVCASGLPRLRADGARLLQVLCNLADNAVKFTPAGGRIRVEGAVAEDDLHVIVADTGPGIPADQIPHIFHAFRQAETADRRGVGLGLWIARAIVEAHGGRIWVDSREGHGSRFCFVVPARIDGGSAARDGGGAETHSDLPPMPAT